MDPLNHIIEIQKVIYLLVLTEIILNDGKYFINYHSKFPINESSPFIIELICISDFCWNKERFSIRLFHNTLISSDGFNKTFNLSNINGISFNNKFTIIYFKQWNRSIILIKIILFQFSNHAQLFINNQYHNRVTLNLMNQTYYKSKLFTISKFPIHLNQYFYVHLIINNSYVEVNVSGFKLINITKAGIYNSSCMAVSVKQMTGLKFVYFYLSIKFKPIANLQLLRIGSVNYVIQIYHSKLSDMLFDRISSAMDSADMRNITTSFHKYNIYKGPINKSCTISIDSTDDYSVMLSYSIFPKIIIMKIENISSTDKIIYKLQINFHKPGLYQFVVLLNDSNYGIYYFALYDKKFKVKLEPDRMKIGKRLYCKTNTLSALYILKWECKYGSYIINSLNGTNRSDSKVKNDILVSLKFESETKPYFLYIYYLVFELLLNCYCIGKNNDQLSLKYTKDVYQEEIKEYNKMFETYFQFQEINRIHLGFWSLYLFIWFIIMILVFLGISIYDINQRNYQMYLDLLNQTFYTIKQPPNEDANKFESFYFDLHLEENRLILDLAKDRFILLKAIKEIVCELVSMKDTSDDKVKELVERQLCILYILIDHRDYCPNLDFVEYEIDLDEIIKMKSKPHMSYMNPATLMSVKMSMKRPTYIRSESIAAFKKDKALKIKETAPNDLKAQREYFETLFEKKDKQKKKPGKNKETTAQYVLPSARKQITPEVLRTIDPNDPLRIKRLSRLPNREDNKAMLQKFTTKRKDKTNVETKAVAKRVNKTKDPKYPDLVDHFKELSNTRRKNSKFMNKLQDQVFDNISDLQLGRPSITRPSITRPSITRPSITRLSITRPSITRPSITQPSITRLSITRPSITQRSLARPSFATQSLGRLSNTRPSITRPSITQRSLARPSITRPSITQRSLAQPSITRPSITQRSLARPSTTTPSLGRLSITRPSITQQNLARPSTTTPSLGRLSIRRPSITRQSIKQRSLARPSTTTPSLGRLSVFRPSILKVSITGPSITPPSITPLSISTPSNSRPSILRTSTTRPSVYTESIITSNRSSQSTARQIIAFPHLDRRSKAHNKLLHQSLGSQNIGTRTTGNLSSFGQTFYDTSDIETGWEKSLSAEKAFIDISQTRRSFRYQNRFKNFSDDKFGDPKKSKDTKVKQNLRTDNENLSKPDKTIGIKEIFKRLPKTIYEYKPTNKIEKTKPSTSNEYKPTNKIEKTKSSTSNEDTDIESIDFETKFRKSMLLGFYFESQEDNEKENTSMNEKEKTSLLSSLREKITKKTKPILKTTMRPFKRKKFYKKSPNKNSKSPNFIMPSSPSPFAATSKAETTTDIRRKLSSLIRLNEELMNNELYDDSSSRDSSSMRSSRYRVRDLSIEDRARKRFLV